MILKRNFYSKKEESSKKKKKNSGNSSIALGAGLYVGGTAANTALGRKFSKRLTERFSKEDELMYKKLKRLAEKKGIKVNEDAITGIGPAYAKGVIMPDMATNKGDFISHELGHAHFDKGKAKGIGEKIGKAAHKVYLKGGALQHLTFAPIAGVVAGIRSGRKKAEAEKEGKEESKLNRHSAWGTSLAVQTPGLISEAAASKYGLNVLKKAGASKKYLKASKKNLLGAFGTYASLAAANSGLGELSRGIAYKTRKKKLEKEEEKKNKEKD